MAIYLIALTHPRTDVLERVEKLWAGNHFKITDSLILVAPAVASSRTIAEQIGISTDEDKAMGIVLELSEKFAGVLPSNSVDWYNNARATSQN